VSLGIPASFLDKAEVTGSSPVSPTGGSPISWGFFVSQRSQGSNEVPFGAVRVTLGGLGPLDRWCAWLPGSCDAAARLSQGVAVVGELGLEGQLFAWLAASVFYPLPPDGECDFRGCGYEVDLEIIKRVLRIYGLTQSEWTAVTILGTGVAKGARHQDN
jgi:hypothetical protein